MLFQSDMRGEVCVPLKKKYFILMSSYDRCINIIGSFFNNKKVKPDFYLYLLLIKIRFYPNG